MNNEYYTQRIDEATYLSYAGFTLESMEAVDGSAQRVVRMKFTGDGVLAASNEFKTRNTLVEPNKFCQHRRELLSEIKAAGASG